MPWVRAVPPGWSHWWRCGSCQDTCWWGTFIHTRRSPNGEGRCATTQSLLLVSLGVPSVSRGLGAVLSARSLFHGWAFSSSGSSIGTVALTTLALKSFCPGFGAFCVDTRYRVTAAVKHQKALIIVGAERVGFALQGPTALGADAERGLNWVCGLLSVF